MRASGKFEAHIAEAGDKYASRLQTGSLRYERALLPKLLSGEIRVKDAEKFVEGIREV